VGGKRKADEILVGRPGGKRPQRRPRLRLEDNIKMDLREIRSGSMNWVFYLVQERSMRGSCEHGNKSRV
jgi:hypothetical protein